jgi:Xaa-Pro aminopeptidase
VVVAETAQVLPHRDRVGVVNRILEDRLDNLLPSLMRETGIDMWLVLNREYNEDPVYLTLVPEPALAARRTTMLVFFDRGPEEGLERVVVGRYPLGDLYASVWGGGTKAEQWQRLAEVVAEREPKRIGVNVSRDWSFGDGLSAGLRDSLLEALGPDLGARVVPAQDLCVRWLESRTDMEMELFPHMVTLARSVVAEAFSNRVITPGATTTDDVAWFIRRRFAELNLPIWFMPYVNVQHHGDSYEKDDPFFGKNDVVIRRGDVLHTDVGIHYLRLNTDNQEMGYVLRLGEEDVPRGLKAALAAGNRMQDLLTREFRSGRTGNEILAAALEAAGAEGIVATIYTHPLGFYGHAAGPTIGMWDNQGATPIQGDWRLHPDTAYAIEGNVKVQVPEWDDQWVQIKLEQGGYFDGEAIRYLGGRQTGWHLVR